jgi:AbrB family looped-hinge helix DNA binding protein
MKGNIYSARLTSKGQITIPKKVRDRLGVREGEEIYFCEEDGVFQVKRTVERSPFDKWVGFLRETEGERTDDIIEEMRGR